MIGSAQLLAAIPYALDTVDLTGFGPKDQRKVRDIYRKYFFRRLGDQRLLITTDRELCLSRIATRYPFPASRLSPSLGDS